MTYTVSALEQGERTPDFNLPASDGTPYSLSSFPQDTLLTVVFLANHCPYVGSWEDRLVDIAREYAGRGVEFAGISSSDVSKFPKDSSEEMAKKNYPFPYLYDETQSVARSFGATRTPEVFLFDRDRRLRYHGAIDSDWEDGQDLQPYLRQALDALLGDSEVSQPETRPVGCTIKFRD